jgi:hypothetical protein
VFRENFLADEIQEVLTGEEIERMYREEKEKVKKILEMLSPHRLSEKI